jgi:hypothetical protein
MYFIHCFKDTHGANTKRTVTLVSIFGHDCLSHMLYNFFLLFFAPHGRCHACLSLKAYIMTTVSIRREAGHRCWLAGWLAETKDGWGESVGRFDSIEIQRVENLNVIFSVCVKLHANISYADGISTGFGSFCRSQIPHSG